MNDIALLRLDTSPYNLERRAAAGHPTTPVPLCPAALQPEGRKCRVSGWGHLKSKGSGVPDKLRELEVKVRGRSCSGAAKGHSDRRSPYLLGPSAC